jgi:hypothetical protein
MLLSYLFASGRIPWLPYAGPSTKYKPSKAQRAREQTFFDDVRKREQERTERERLRKLFESSFDDNDKKA